MSVALFGRHSALLIPLGLMLAAPPADAAVILPSNITVSTPAGSTDTSSPFTDDVLLGSLTFGTNNVYDGTTGSFSVAQQFEVITGRSQINAEWGDSDDGTDGNDNPFVKAGIVNAGDPISTGPGGLQETTDPADQDAALLNAFNSRSLSEITDGEGGSLTVFKVLFEQSLAFDDVGGDGLPDIVFFERGLNDVFEVQLITGGSFAAPSLSDPVIVDSGDFADAGFDINTVEISGDLRTWASVASIWPISGWARANRPLAFGSATPTAPVSAAPISAASSSPQRIPRISSRRWTASRRSAPSRCPVRA